MNMSKRSSAIAERPFDVLVSKRLADNRKLESLGIGCVILRLAILTQYQLVTNIQTDRHRMTAYTGLAQCHSKFYTVV